MTKLSDQLPIFLTSILKRIIVRFRFLELKKFTAGNKAIKNRYSGEVLILGSGKSVLRPELNRVVGKNIIFTNNSLKLSFYTTLKENNNCFYIVAPVHPPASREIWSKWINEVINDDNVIYFLGINNYKDSLHNYIAKKENIFYYAPLLDRRIEIFGAQKDDFELHNPMFGAGAVSVYAILLAIYLGFDKIGLLGVDHSQVLHHHKASRGRFYNSSEHTDMEQFDLESVFRNQANTFYQYRLIKDWFKNIQIINLGGDESILDTFEKKDFMDVID